jgi:hypothetical protein
MTWAGTSIYDGLPVNGRRVPAKWLDNDESTFWNYDEEDFYFEAE